MSRPKQQYPRIFAVTIRFSQEEWNHLQKQKENTALSLAAYLRNTILKATPTTIPSINQSQWIELSRLAANFNQLLHQIHLGIIPFDYELISHLSSLLTEIRNALIGVNNNEKQNWTREKHKRTR